MAYNRPTDEEIVKRISEYMKIHKIRKSDIADTLGWAPSKVTKIFAGDQKLYFQDLEKLTAALGYPLEAFVQEDYDLAQYERENGPTSLEDILYIYKDEYLYDDSVRQVIAEELPYTMRTILDLNMQSYAFFVEHDHRAPVNGHDEDGKEFPRRWPKTVIRMQGIRSRYDDYLELGYFFAENDAVALAIKFSPDLNKGKPINGIIKRQFYKSMIEGMETESYDQYRETGRKAFDPSLSLGEICSIIYRLEEPISNLKLESDLRMMFGIYEKLILEAMDRIESFFWQNATSTLDMSFRIMGDQNIADEAKMLTGYKCFIDNSHESFEDRTGHNYVDTMHLVPLANDKEYEADLDVIENIVCLCPNCMARLYEGKDIDREKMLVDIYYRKKDELEKAGIKASLAQILKMNGIE